MATEVLQIPMPRVHNPGIDKFTFQRLVVRVEVLEKLLAAQGMGVVVEEPKAEVEPVAEEFIEMDGDGEVEPVGDLTAETVAIAEPITVAAIEPEKPRRGRPAKGAQK